MFSLSWRKYLPHGESGCFLFTISGIGDHSAAHPITHVLANNQDLTCSCSRRDCFEHFLSCSPGSPSPVVHAGNAAIAAGNPRHCDARSCHRAGHRAGGRLHIALATMVATYLVHPPSGFFLWQQPSTPLSATNQTRQGRCIFLGKGRLSTSCSVVL